MVLDRPDDIEPHALGFDKQARFTLVHVAIVVILVGGKDVLDSYFHDNSLLGPVVIRPLRFIRLRQGHDCLSRTQYAVPQPV